MLPCANRTKLGLKMTIYPSTISKATRGRQSNQAGIEKLDAQDVINILWQAPIEPSWD